MKTIQVRRTRHAGHCWRSKDEFSDVLLWTPAYGQAKAGRPARTYIQQLCEDTGCSPEDLPKAMNDKEEWREKVRDIRASGTTWWWWFLVGKVHRYYTVLRVHIYPTFWPIAGAIIDGFMPFPKALEPSEIHQPQSRILTWGGWSHFQQQ